MPTGDEVPDQLPRAPDPVALAAGVPDKSPYRYAGRLVLLAAGFALVAEGGLILAAGRWPWWITALWPLINVGMTYNWYRASKIAGQWRNIAATWRRSSELWERAYDRAYRRMFRGS